MCSGSPWNAFFPPDLFITFSVHPAKKRIFYLRKGLSWPKWSFPVFCVVCVVWSHRAALLACQLGAGINFAFYSFVGAKHLYIFSQRKKGVYLMKEILKIFFSIRKEPFHFFPISVCWALILQLFRRCPGNNYCRHVAGILMIIGKPPGLVGAEQPVCQAKKRLQAILRIENNFEGIYSSSQELKQITRNWKCLLHY